MHEMGLFTLSILNTDGPEMEKVGSQPWSLALFPELTSQTAPFSVTFLHISIHCINAFWSIGYEIHRKLARFVTSFLKKCQALGLAPNFCPSPSPSVLRIVKVTKPISCISYPNGKV